MMPPKLKNGNPVRKHVTTACTPCRDAKAKCDGSKPSCKNCESKNKVCSYRQRDDKRKIPIRIAVTLLAERVAFLSQLIRNNGLEVPEMNEADQDTLRSILQTLGLRCEGVRVGDQESSNSGAILPENERVISVASQVTNGQTNMTNTQRSDLGGRGDYNYTGNDLHAFCEAPDPQIPVEDVSEGTLLIDCDSANSTHIGPTQNGQIPNPLPGMSRMHDQDPTQPRPNEIPISGLPETDSDDEVVEQLSYRLGRVQVTHDGQLRYFGSTSNLTLLDALVSIGNPNSTSVQKDMQDTLENLKLDMQVEEAFEKHLLELYFAWQDPCLHVVNIEAFWKARLQNRYEDSNSQYYSRSLCDAMCAMGAAYEPKFHPDLVTFPRSLSEFFSDRAKTLLEAEIENPSLATVQTLVILSNYEASSTRDSRGWLYSGMAMRLAFDLGLHLDMIPYVEKGIISAEECETRRTVFWGAYLNEQFWGYYLGRSARSPMAGVTVRKPYWNDSYSTIHTAARWRAYGCPQVSIQSISNPIDMICGQWVSLYDLMLPATDVLYGCLEISKTALQELTADTVARLINWKNNLPEGLNVEIAKGTPQYLPHVLTLHMQYYQFMIHCHRPYISKHYIQPQPPQGPGSAHAREVCVDSAVSIVKILAALILIFATVPGGTNKQDDELVKYLSTCFWALDEIGGYFENARRTSIFLSTLQQQWHKRRRNMAQRSLKRDSRSALDAGKAQKRSRTATGTEDWPGLPHSNSSANATRTVDMESPIAYDSHGLSLMGDDASEMVDFMYPEICNMLLSEGIPRPLY